MAASAATARGSAVTAAAGASTGADGTAGGTGARATQYRDDARTTRKTSF